MDALLSPASSTTTKVNAIEYPSATGSSRRRVGLTYDNEGRVTRVYEGSQDYANTFTYHPSGAILGYTSGNSVSNTFAFDANRYWPTSISAAGWTMGYQDYDGVGNVGTITDSRSGTVRAWATMRWIRLTSASGVYGSATYAYDAHGNRQTAGGTSYSYESGTLRLSQQGSTSFGYDDNGNMTSAGSLSFTYTPDNLLATSSGGAVNATYAYDADQWRVKRTDGSTVSYALRSPDGQLLTDWRPGSSTATVQDYVYVGTRLVAAISRTVTEPSPSVVCPATPTELVNMNFESGASLASLGFTYDYAASNQSGGGLGSTWGVRSTGSASDKY